MRTPILLGRDFSDRDDAAAPKVMLNPELEADDTPGMARRRSTISR
jgi:hypothetical protein